MKIDPSIFINLLKYLAFSCELEIIKDQNTYVYKIGETADKFYILLRGNLEMHMPIESKKQLSQIEYLDILKDLFNKKEKVLLDKTISANNKILFVNKIEEEDQLRNLLIREGNSEAKYNFLIFSMQKICDLEAFQDFGDKGLETRHKRRMENIINKSQNTIVLAIEENIYSEKISKELNNYKMRETKFLNENFFFKQITRFNFNKIFDYFKFQEFRKGDILISEKENTNYNYFYFLREGILEVTLNSNLINLIELIKELVYKREYLLKEFLNLIDLEMKNQPEKFIADIKKKRNLHLFRLAGFDVIGVEQIYYKKYDLYKVTVSSEIAKVYRLSIEDLKKVFLTNKNSLKNFNNYAQKKMKNFISRLISSKNTIIQKIDENDSGEKNLFKNSHEKPRSSQKIPNGNKSPINFSKDFLFGSGINSINNKFSEDKITINKINLNKKNFPVRNVSAINFKTEIQAKYLSSEAANYNSKNKSKLMSRSKIKDKGKKYKIIQEGEDLNINYRYHRPLSEYTKENERIFTLLHSISKYKIPNIEKVIEEAVEKINKPLSEIKREKLREKNMINVNNQNVNRTHEDWGNLKEKSNEKLIPKRVFSCQINQSDYEPMLKPHKFQRIETFSESEGHIHEKNYLKELDSPKDRTVENLSNNSMKHSGEKKSPIDYYLYDLNNFNNNQTRVLSPNNSFNTNKNFKAIENILKSEHLDLLISRTKNHYINNTTQPYSSNIDANHYIDPTGYSHDLINNDIIEDSPVNIYNVSSKDIINCSLNIFNLALAKKKNKKSVKVKKDQITNTTCNKDINLINPVIENYPDNIAQNKSKEDAESVKEYQNSKNKEEANVNTYYLNNSLPCENNTNEKKNIDEFRNEINSDILQEKSFKDVASNDPQTIINIVQENKEEQYKSEPMISSFKNNVLMEKAEINNVDISKENYAIHSNIKLLEPNLGNKNNNSNTIEELQKTFSEMNENQNILSNKNEFLDNPTQKHIICSRNIKDDQIRNNFGSQNPELKQTMNNKTISREKRDKQISAHMDNPSEILNFENGYSNNLLLIQQNVYINSQNNKYSESVKNIQTSLNQGNFNNKPIQKINNEKNSDQLSLQKVNKDNYISPDKTDKGVNFTNSILNNKIFSSFTKKKNNRSGTSSKQIISPLFDNRSGDDFRIKINECNYISQNSAHIPKCDVDSINKAEKKLIDELNMKRLGLKSVKIKMPSNLSSKMKPMSSTIHMINSNNRVSIKFNNTNKMFQHMENINNSKSLKNILEIKKISTKNKKQ